MVWKKVGIRLTRMYEAKFGEAYAAESEDAFAVRKKKNKKAVRRETAETEEERSKRVRQASLVRSCDGA